VKPGFRRIDPGNALQSGPTFLDQRQDARRDLIQLNNRWLTIG
jgi:hypothetical protein